MRGVILIGFVLALVALPSQAEARGKRKVLRLLEDALEEAEDDRGCRRSVGRDLEEVIADVEDDRDVARDLEDLLDSADDCPRAVERALKKALRLLDDADDDDDEEPAKDAIEIAEARCKSGKAGACYDAAAHYESGTGGAEMDHTRSAELYERSCDRGSVKGCNAKGNVYKNGFGGVEVDKRVAKKSYKRACNGGHADACFNLGYLYDDSKPKKALALYQKACGRKSADGCNAVGNAHENGYAGLRKSRKKARTFHTKACRLASGAGCFNLAEAYEDRGDDSNANAYFAQACNFGYSDACPRVDHGKLLKDGLNSVSKMFEGLQKTNFSGR